MRPIKGKPLLQWAIEAARCSSLIDQEHIYVSTDSPEYGRFAEKYGAQWIRRPPELSEDVPTEHVILHALKVAENTAGQEDAIWHYDPIVTLQCTTPLMDPEDIDAAIRTYQMNEGIYNSVMTVTSVREHPSWAFKLEGLHLVPFIETETKGDWGVRQLLPPLYRPNGAVYVTKTSFLREHKALIGEPLGFHYMPLERSWEADEPIDLVFLEALAQWKE
jgi:CMP-N,N'-diacetyllegionaminic acid synthase